MGNNKYHIRKMQNRSIITMVSDLTSG